MHICMYIVYTLLLSNYCQKKTSIHHISHSIYTQYIYIYVCMYCNISIYAMLGKYVRWTMLKNTHNILYIVVGKNMYVYIYIYYVNIIL